MAFDPVLWLLVYLLIGSLIWMFSWFAGHFEMMPARSALAASIYIIAGWFPIAVLTVVAFRVLADVEDQP